MSLRSNKPHPKAQRATKPSGALPRRLALRDILAHRSRSALILALVAFPLMVLSAVMVVLQSGQPTRGDDATMRLGQFETRLVSHDFAVGAVQHPNDYYVWFTNDPNHVTASLPTEPGQHTASGDDSQARTGSASRATLEAAIPQDASSVMLTSSQTQLQGEGLKLEVPVTIGQISDPRFAGRFELLEGAWGSLDGLQLTPDLAKALDISVGGIVQIEGNALRVAGIVRDRSVYADSGNLTVSSLGLSGRQNHGMFLGSGNAVAQKLAPHEVSFFVEKMGLTVEQQAGYNAQGIASIHRGFLLDPPPEVTSSSVGTRVNEDPTIAIHLMIVIVAFLVFLEVGMLAGAAFAVGAKKQKRVLSLLASNGANPGTLRMIAGYTGLYLGLAGVLLGTSMGLLLAWLTVLWGNNFAVGFPGWHVPWATIAPLMFVALGCAVAASLVPSWVSAKHSALHALRGAAGPSPAGTKKPIIGYAFMGMAAVAWGIALYLGLTARTIDMLQERSSMIQNGFIVGMLLCTIGLIMTIGSVLGLAGKIGHRLPLAGRLAIRDVHRNAARNIPVVTSVIAGVALSTAITLAVGVGIAADGPRTSEDSARTLAISMGNQETGGAKPSKERQQAVLAELTRLGHVPTQQAVTQSPYAGKHQHDTEGVSYNEYNMLLAPGSKCRFGIGELLSSDQPDYQQMQRWADNVDEVLGQADRFTARYCNIENGAAGSPLAGDFQPVVTDRKGLELLLGDSMTTAIGKAFDESKVIVAAPEYVSSGGVLRIAMTDTEYLSNLTNLDETGMSFGRHGNLTLHPITNVTELEAIEIKALDAKTPRIIMPGNALRGTGAILGGETLMAKVEKPLTSQEADELGTAVAQHGAFFVPADLQTRTDRLMAKLPLLLMIAAGLLVLTTTGITTGLALADGRDDARTITGIGATTATRRKLSGIQAGFTALLGTGFGVLLGAIPMLLMMATMFGTVDTSLAKPLWLLLALPPLAGLIGWLMVPRRVSAVRVGA